MRISEKRSEPIRRVAPSLVSGLALMKGRGSSSHYALGTTERVLHITSSVERLALIEIAKGRDPLTSPLIGIDEKVRREIEIFIESLHRSGFLNTVKAQLKPPQRYFDEISESDLAAQHFQVRSKLELTQSEWIDLNSDGGVAALSHRGDLSVILSGRSRVTTLLYSILLACGVTRVRFADRHHQPIISSTDIGFGPISNEHLGLDFYQVAESARRGLSLFPIGVRERHDRDTSKPALLIHYGDCDPEELVGWANQKTPHVVIQRPIGDEIVIGPLVLPGGSPCIRCLSLYELDNFGYTRQERIDINEVGELPSAAAHYVAAVIASQALHYLDTFDNTAGGNQLRNTGVGEVLYLNIQRLTQPQVVAIARHPLCGCGYAAIT